MNTIYTGIGARKTPQDILDIMTKLAVYFDNKKYILRSGGAIGADTAFEKGSTKKEIYRPDQCNNKALDIASKFHPNWSNLSNYVKKLHGRNAFQILGIDLNNPSKFVICWTPDGCISHKDRTKTTGGTGTAISIANNYNIPIYNLKRKDHYDLLMKLL